MHSLQLLCSLSGPYNQHLAVKPRRKTSWAEGSPLGSITFAGQDSRYRPANRMVRFFSAQLLSAFQASRTTPSRRATVGYIKPLMGYLTNNLSSWEINLLWAICPGMAEWSMTVLASVDSEVLRT